ncbi:MAG TPA: hypothetical protein VIV06_11210, partial [Candidatus Limnocylindrales bacterium]
SKLGWLRAAGRARVLDPAASAERTLAIGLLRAKYPQYADHPLGALPLIRIELTRATWWGSLRPR